MAVTTTSALSAAITFKVQQKVLENLRPNLVWADPAYSEQGEFDPGHDTLSFVNVPDFSVFTTALTEGTAPTAVALTIGTVQVSTVQYGNVLSISDLAKVKAPFQIVDIATERIGWQAKLTIDQVSRDLIAASGTPYYESTVTTRAGLGAGNLIVATDLRKLKSKMRAQHIPPMEDGRYVIVVHPFVAFDLRNDSATGSFIDINKYMSNETLLRGEIGELEGFRIVVSETAPTFSSTVTVYGSIAFGRIHGWGTGDLQTLKTYHVAPGNDHSDPIAQQELVGWKIAFGTAALNNGYFYRLETAATAL